MKSLWILLYLMGVGVVPAARAERPKNCRYLYNFLVIQKLGNQSYEISFQGLGYGSSRETALLETTETNFDSSGKASLPVVPIGKRKMRLTSGFDGLLQVYKEAPECKQPESSPKIVRKTEPTEEQAEEEKVIRPLLQYQWRYDDESKACEEDEGGVVGEFRSVFPPGSNILSQSPSKIVLKSQSSSKLAFYYTSKSACENDKARRSDERSKPHSSGSD